MNENSLTMKTNILLKKIERKRKVYLDKVIDVDSCAVMVTKQLRKNQENLPKTDLPGVITATLPKFKIYNLVYKAMESADVTIRLDKSKWMNEKSEEVSDPFKEIRVECTHILIHPEYVLFADEVGCNTNQKDDGKYGGEKRLTKRGSSPKQMCSSSDAHWTLFEFTDATGQPVMCRIIFKGESLTPEER